MKMGITKKTKQVDKQTIFRECLIPWNSRRNMRQKLKLQQRKRKQVAALEKKREGQVQLLEVKVEVKRNLQQEDLEQRNPQAERRRPRKQKWTLRCVKIVGQQLLGSNWHLFSCQ